MDRGDRPGWPWRLLAYATLVLVGLPALPALFRGGAIGWTFLANWIAIAGTFAYAHGWTARPLWFWRIFALLFSLHTMASLGGLIGRFVAIAVHAPEGLSASDWIIFLATLSVCSLVCLALLGHAGLLRFRQRRTARMYERIFA